MAATKNGDLVENLLHAGHELFLTGMQAHYKLLVQASLNVDDPRSNDNFANAMKAANLLFTRKGDTIFTKAAQAIHYLDTGERITPIPAVPQQAAFIRSAMITGPQNVIKKKIIANVSALSPDDFDDVVNYTAQAAAQQTMAPIKQAQINTVQASSKTGKIYYARKPEGSACDFCMSLAMKGCVYVNKPHFHSHNNCRCTPVVSNKPIQYDAQTQKRIQDWMDEHSANLRDSGSKKGSTAHRDDLVARGLRKKVVRRIPVYKEKTDEFGNTIKVPAGHRTQITYQPTQKATQLEDIQKSVKSKAFKTAMNDAPKPAHAPEITAENAADEVAAYRDFVEVKTDDGRVLNVVKDMEDYRVWATKMGVLDERVIRAAGFNKKAAEVSYEQAVKRVAAERLNKLLNDLVTRIGYKQRNNPLIFEEVHPISFWQHQFSGHDVDALKVALTRAGIVYR